MTTIRTATHNDWPAIRRVLSSAGGGIGSSYWRELMEKELILVAEEQEQVVGFGVFYPEEEEIESLYVMKERQGEGLGSMLLAKLEEVAMQRGTHEVMINAAYGSETFYDMKGYRRVGEEGPSHRRIIIMKKKLQH